VGYGAGLSIARQRRCVRGGVRVLHLNEPAESVYMGDTTIADLRIVAPDVVYVYGRKIGNLKLFGSRVVAVGRARSVEEALDVQDTADTFSPSDQPPINNTTIAGSQQVNIRVRSHSAAATRSRDRRVLTALPRHQAKSSPR